MHTLTVAYKKKKKNVKWNISIFEFVYSLPLLDKRLRTEILLKTDLPVSIFHICNRPVLVKTKHMPSSVNVRDEPTSSICKGGKTLAPDFI